mmetsp:Transcript_22641/g.22839  ORF Transcript_22641/g.22839 Transcript_22641/m.22839 type:complete len:246 (-) Transcript_22641:313-1050(-)
MQRTVAYVQDRITANNIRQDAIRMLEADSDDEYDNDVDIISEDHSNVSSIIPSSCINDIQINYQLESCVIDNKKYISSTSLKSNKQKEIESCIKTVKKKSLLSRAFHVVKRFIRGKKMKGSHDILVSSSSGMVTDRESDLKGNRSECSLTNLSDMGSDISSKLNVSYSSDMNRIPSIRTLQAIDVHHTLDFEESDDESVCVIDDINEIAFEITSVPVPAPVPAVSKHVNLNNPYRLRIHSANAIN